jgi:hypothetical protein
MRMPLSKQRNKHIQHVLVEAAKLAPRQSAELALLHQKAMEKGNRNRATLAVARNWRVISSTRGNSGHALTFYMWWRYM